MLTNNYSNQTLTAKQLSCERGDRILFSKLDLSITNGEVLYIKGSNGSGKSSLLRLLSGLMQADHGDILWNDEFIASDPWQYHQNLLFIGHQAGIKTKLSVRENLEFYCQLNSDNNQQFIDQAIEQFYLTAFADDWCEDLSAGQQRRVALARLALEQKSLWILDEPFNALDVNAHQVVNDCITNHCQRGGMLIVTSHQDLLLNHDKVSQLTLGEAA